MFIKYRKRNFSPGCIDAVVPCGTKFLRVLILAIFFAIRKNKFPQNKNDRKFFSAKIYSTVGIIYKNTGLKEKMP